MVTPPIPTTQQQYDELRNAYDYLERGIRYNLGSKPGYISMSSEASAASEAFQRAGMEKSQADRFVKETWVKAIETSSPYIEAKTMTENFFLTHPDLDVSPASWVGKKPGELTESPYITQLREGKITIEQLTPAQRGALGLQNFRTTIEGGLYNFQTGIYTKPSGEQISASPSQLQFAPRQTITQQQIVAQKLSVPSQQALGGRAEFIAYRNPITGETRSYAPQFAPKGWEKIAISPQGKVLGSVVTTSDTSVGLVQAREDFQKAIKASPTKAEVSEYEKAGFSEDEAVLLARYSKGVKQTPSPEIAKAVLDFDKSVTAPRELFVKGLKEYGRGALKTLMVMAGPKPTPVTFSFKESWKDIPLPIGPPQITPSFRQAQKIMGDPDSRAFLVKTGVGASMFLPIDWSTRIALIYNEPKMEELVSPITYRQTKRFGTAAEIAVDLGITVGTGAAIGAGLKVVEKGAQLAGIKALTKLSEGGKYEATRALRGVAGASLLGVSKVVKFGAESYFKSVLVSDVLDIPIETKIGGWKAGAMATGELAATYTGFIAGEKIAERGVDIALTLRAKKVPVEIETTLKRMPQHIQAQMLSESGKKLAIYRRGPLEIGNVLNPRFDKYVGGAATPRITKQIFFRYAETEGVTENPIKFVPSVPSFVQPPKYSEMFMANVRQEPGNIVKRVYKAFAKTPILTDVLVSGIEPTKPFSSADKVVEEFATKGELTKGTKIELSKQDSLISDKLREYSLTEQELVLRERKKFETEPVELIGTYPSRTKLFGLIPMTEEKLIPIMAFDKSISPVKSILMKSRIITKQDAAFIKRQYGFYKKYGKDLVLPREHGPSHGMRVEKNVEKLLQAYPELYVRNVAGLKTAALYHDIGKTSESSLEFGRQHGQKFYEVWKARLMPKEIQGIGKKAAEAVKVHETISTGKFIKIPLTRREIFIPSIRYNVKKAMGEISAEEEILATADRLDLPREGRYKIKVKPKLLPLQDAFKRLGLSEPKPLTFKERKKQTAEPVVEYPTYPLEQLFYKTEKAKMIYPKQESVLKVKEPVYKKEKYEIDVGKYEIYKKPYIQTYYKPSVSYKQPSYYKEPYKKSIAYKGITTYKQPAKYKTPYRFKALYKLKYPPTIFPPKYPPRKAPPKLPPKLPELKIGMIDKNLLGGKSFDVFVIKKRKPVVIARGVSELAGLDIGTRAVGKSLRATFGLRASAEPLRQVETGREFARYKSLFREPTLKSPYKKYGRVYVQKQTAVKGLGRGRLTFKGEKLEIQSARRNKMEKYLR